MKTRHASLITLLAAATLGAAAGASAQSYPTRPIRLVIAQTVGGNADFVARQFGERLSQRFGHQIVADNRPGGGGVIGPETVARAAPDGYTLLLAPTSFGINPALHAKLPYDPIRDFAPISLRTRCASKFEASAFSSPARPLRSLPPIESSTPSEMRPRPSARSPLSAGGRIAPP